MEFGALQCTPNTPDCLFCPLQQQCFAFRNGLVQVLPHKSRARASRQRFFHYFVLQWQNQCYLKKRSQSDIWQGLYDFYLHETDSGELPWEETQDHLETLGIKINNHQPPAKTYKHLLTHQQIFARFHRLELAAPLSPEALARTDLVLFTSTELEQIPKPVMIARYLKEVFF
jgi:A/G-specific adenine glycosylase